ncbi:Zinc finger, BED-type [Artemisia annua]|uniref:Zinc finger, BED-type n=1 Tax=Artemisia annua TaxID=35608 RepID=A0A2U1M0X9_ARTAN|nr:Zinc finger, BED-type [Artemisia annua]
MSLVVTLALVDGRFDMMKMRESMTHWILMHENPFTIVEEESLKKNESVPAQKSELDNYHKEEVYICDDNSKDFGVLAWWRANSLRYHILSRILAIPITTVASKATSARSRVIDTYKASLAPETVEVLLYREDWCRSLHVLERKNKKEKKPIELPAQKSELDNYHKEEVYICYDNSKDFGVLAWWRANSLRYHILSRILAIPITIVASKATSARSRVIDTYRASLAPETVEVLLCREDWCRSLHGLERKNKKEKNPIEVILPIT